MYSFKKYLILLIIIDDNLLHETKNFYNTPRRHVSQIKVCNFVEKLG